MKASLTRKDIEAFICTHDLESTSLQKIIEGVINDAEVQRFAPESLCQIDPRNGDVVVYNSSRSRRVHTTIAADEAVPGDDSDQCPICRGELTPIIDVADLSEGFTFINKNLYPIFHPQNIAINESTQERLPSDPFHHGRPSNGIHLLQWTSSVHDQDWHNMSLDDCRIAFQRLGVVEKKLLYDSKEFMPESNIGDHTKPTHGYVSIIKNYGRSAGASLTHGHQQIGFNNIMPRKFFNNYTFLQRNKKMFSRYMLDENPHDLIVRDLGTAILIVPYFMRRAFDMLLIVKDTNKQYIHELTSEEMGDITEGIQLAIQGIIHLMQQQGKTPSYNLVVNNGPGAGLYFEFMAHTQELGGFEYLGLWVCQANTLDVATELRRALN